VECRVTSHKRVSSFSRSCSSTTHSNQSYTMLRSSSTRLVRSRVAPIILAASPRSFSCSIPTTSPSPSPSPSPRSTNTISQQEIAHFSSLSAHWWDPTGEFGLLHRMNPKRIQFMRDSILMQKELPKGKWLHGMDVLDVGCGGGIFAEVRSVTLLQIFECFFAESVKLRFAQSIARLGANTLAIDASPSNVSVAQTHATLDPSLNLINSQIPRPSSLSSLSTPPTRGSLEYRHCAAEDLEQEGKQFDVVCAMEVIEHVEDPRGFLECLMNLTKVNLAPFLISLLPSFTH